MLWMNWKPCIDDQEEFMKIGILGAGRIAAKFANTMNQVPEAECWAVAARSLERAGAFAEEWNFTRAFGSYEEMLSDPQVELIYVATPHSHHYEHMKLCLEHGKHVLCEKAFTLNAAQAREISELAAAKGCYLAEALWTRYMPSRQIIDELLSSGIIGKVRMLTANLCYPVSHKARIMDPALGGGALLDLGVYGLNFALTHLGQDIVDVDTTVQMTDTGVDGSESITLRYADGTLAVITTSVFLRSDLQGIFSGEKGYLVVENINNPLSASAYDDYGRLLKRVEMPPQLTGYEYELKEAIRCIAEGRICSECITPEYSVTLMELMDRVRQQWNFKFPQE